MILKQLVKNMFIKKVYYGIKQIDTLKITLEDFLNFYLKK